MGAVRSFFQILLIAHSFIHWPFLEPLVDGRPCVRPWGFGAVVVPWGAHRRLLQCLSGNPRTIQCFSVLGMGEQMGWRCAIFLPLLQLPPRKAQAHLGHHYYFFNFEKLSTWGSHRNVVRNPCVSFPHSPNVNVCVLRGTMLT